MIEAAVAWLVSTIGALGYPGITFLMALESSFFPFPSEVVIVPAGYLAQQGQMNLVAVILFGILGSLIGAWVNYAIAVTVGRKALIKWGKWIFLPEEKFIKVEQYLKRHGEIGTFIGRLIPVIRQYISFPAGLAKMPIGRFSFYTGLGAGLWVTILALIGYYVGENQELVQQWSKTAVFWMVVGCGVVVLGYWKIRK
ncbi:DedA family protein [Patescibacteria group bacterium]|nr:DedA family protein [Patescibacteria group bacterium]MBU1123312.1 DedA family protein [Patescibacteria group bacterium]MBU1910852.1 DedA family protein [Patescibacteria group bacterium]